MSDKKIRFRIAKLKRASSDISVNTSSNNPTHFLRPVELIQHARDEFGMASENWPYPTTYKIGAQGDAYYAEVWVDGMDWHHNYWIIEQIQTKEQDGWDPIATPLLIFDDHEDEDKIRPWKFDMMLDSLLAFRRDEKWIKNNELENWDEFWSSFKTMSSTGKDGTPGMVRCQIEDHEGPVQFWMNEEFYPSREYKDAFHAK